MSNLSSLPVGIILVRRLHLYIGLFIGPFLLLAALTGIAYALTPQLESYLYASALRTESRTVPRVEPLSLAEQIRLVSQYVAGDAAISSVRPSASPGDTTRVRLHSLNQSPLQQRAVFIDPVSGQIKGDLTVYGNDGVLALRAWLQRLHRELLMGEAGRLYSELAASWLWVAVLGGAYLGCNRAPRQRTMILHEHVCLGLILSAGLVFVSLTGLGATRYAGEHLSTLGRHLGWVLPASESVNEPVHRMVSQAPSNRASGLIEPALYQSVLLAARGAGIDAAELEIRPPSMSGRTWTVEEVQRRWPTQADAVTIDPHSLAVVDHRHFGQQPLPAKILRWSIDAHTGVLFGLANQVLLLIIGAGIVFMVCLGYVLCWQRRRSGAQQLTLVDAWYALNWVQRGRLVLALVLTALALPLLGMSLMLFVACELLGQHRLARSASSMVKSPP